MSIDIAALYALPDDVPSAALVYVDAGFRVVLVHGVDFPADLDGAAACTCPDPRHNGQPGGGRCTSKGKHPALADWQQGTAEPRTIVAWYGKHPTYNVGLAMGGEARLVALDIDGPEGRASLAKLEDLCGPLPPTLTSASGREDGGEHRIFRLPDGYDLAAVKNRAGILGVGLDVRAEGGQIVVAPSRHASGAFYRWTRAEELAELPAAWAQLLTTEPTKRPLPASSEMTRFLVPDRYAQTALDAACLRLSQAPKGTRNASANREGWSVGRLVGACLVERPTAEGALLQAMAAGGWDDCSPTGHNAATLRNGLDSGEKEPAEPPPLSPRTGAVQTSSASSDVEREASSSTPSAPATPQSVPTIQIREPELQRMVLEGISALATHDRNLYQRAGELVTVVREPDRAEPLCVGRASLAEPCDACGAPLAEGCARDQRTGADVVLRPGTPRLRPISPPVLLERLSVAATWERWNAKSKEWQAAAPPSRVASIIHAPDREKQGVRPIKGLLEAPSLRADGTVIDRPGYDAATGYVLVPSAPFPSVPDCPTQQEAADALRRLWIHCFADFPYRGLGEAPDDWRTSDQERHAQYERARSIPDAFVGLMAILTVVARPAIGGAVPAAIFEAAAQGSGKSKQMHVVSIATTGRPAGVMTFPARGGEVNEEELEKVLGSYAVAGARVVAFDNVKARIGGPALEGKLTAEGVAEFRILGQTTLVTLPWVALMMFSGNNITMNDDVAQRSLLSRLESPREDPRSRPAESFLHADLLAHVRAHRPDIIRDALTILRALFVAQPEMRPPPRVLGSFEAWSTIVPRAIEYAGGPNVLDARPSNTAGATTDNEGDAHMVLMRGWPFDKPAKLKDVLAFLFDAEQEALRSRSQPPIDGRDEVRDAVRSLCKTRDASKPSGKVFGKMLSEVRGKIRDGMRLDATLDRTKVMHWTVSGRQTTEPTS